jgi:hypothetical protein
VAASMAAARVARRLCIARGRNDDDPFIDGASWRGGARTSRHPQDRAMGARRRRRAAQYDSGTVGRGARSARPGHGTRGAWRPGSAGGRRCDARGPQRAVRRAKASLGVQYGAVRRQADRPCTTSRALGVPARPSVKHFSLAPFDQPFLDFSQLKCHKQSIPKL